MQVAVLRHGIEAGTSLVAESIVPHDEGARIVRLQRHKQPSERRPLCFGSRVCGLAVGPQAAFVADADGITVVSLAMGTRFRKRTAVADRSVACDVIVIPDVAEAAAKMVFTALPETIALVGTGGRTVQDDECDGTRHSYIQL